MEMYRVVGLTICRHGGSKSYIWLDAEPREEFNGIKIIFIGQSMWKLLPRSVRPTQREQSIAGTLIPGPWNTDSRSSC